MEQIPSDLSQRMAEVARELASARNVDQTLQTIAELSVLVIDDADYAGVSVMNGTRIVAAAATDPLVVVLDELQDRFAEGPCTDAVRDVSTAYAEDLSSDIRWPRFGPSAAGLGVRSLLAYRLYLAEECLGSLNLYSRRVHAYSSVDRDVAVIFAAHAAVALGAANTLARSAAESLNLHEALLTRDVIGQAKGILMEREHVDAEEAFEILRRASQRLNIKVHDVAEQLARPSGESPSTRGDSPGG